MASIKYTERKLGRKRKGTFEKKVKGFKAKYEGTCMECKKTVQVGEMIGWFAYGKVYHIKCPDSPTG